MHSFSSVSSRFEALERSKSVGNLSKSGRPTILKPLKLWRPGASYFVFFMNRYVNINTRGGREEEDALGLRKPMGGRAALPQNTQVENKPGKLTKNYKLLFFIIMSVSRILQQKTKQMSQA